MKVVAFLTEHAVVDRIMEHLKLTYVADKPQPSHISQVGCAHGGQGEQGLLLIIVITGIGSLLSFDRCGGVSYLDRIIG